MPYRDEQRCHLCGELTRVVCPRCANPVCAEHTLAGRLEGASAAKQAGAERLARRLGGLEACERCVELELEASQGPFVAIMRSGDPIQTQMVVEALIDEGFDARAIGTQNAALLGAGQHIFEQRVEVPQPQAEAALAVIDDLEAGQPGPAPEDLGSPGGLRPPGADDLGSPGGLRPPGADDLGSPGGLRPPGADDIVDADQGEAEDGAAASPAPRRRGIAAGLAFIFPGASHYYAQHPWTGMLLTATFTAGVLTAGQGFLVAGSVMMVGSVLLDLVTGQLAVTAHNRGKPRSIVVQIAQGAVMGGLLFVLGRLAELSR